MSSEEASGSSSGISPEGSPYSSPSQQVPQLTSFLTQLKCADNTPASNEAKPYLRIIEQPQGHFRFRYRSEMLGTHGCIFGRSHVTNKTKTHPTVELVNYNRRAIIRCCLAQHKNLKEHPNQLFEDIRYKDSEELPVKGKYKIAFPDMGVIHNSKNEVKSWLFQKYTENHRKQGTTFNPQQVRAHCDSVVKEIDMNIVRLKFSARDVDTGIEICEPVYSDPIHNMKSAATNDLKICRLSKINGSAGGGDDVIMLCEKVNKKNIKIRFFEIENGVRTWTAMGIFIPSDVHHQYAIMFRTPPYANKQIDKNVTVYIELFRPSDQRHSEPFEFTYLADKKYKYGKKRRADSSLSSLTSSSGGSIKSLSDLPTVVANHTSLNESMENQENVPSNYNRPQQPSSFVNVAQPESLSAGYLLSDALHQALNNPHHIGPTLSNITIPSVSNDMQLNYITEPPEIQINSEDFERLLRQNPNMSEDDKKRLLSDTEWTEYMKAFSLTEGASMDYVADSPRPVCRIKSSVGRIQYESSQQEDKLNKNNEYNAFYTAQDGHEVKQIVKELVEIMRTKTGYKKHEVRLKLERLFELRLSNGDTFLHMTLCNNQPSMDIIVKMIHSMKMSHLLNYQNELLQTVLHLAVANDMPHHVEFLVANGCNPMLLDGEGNNAMHYAVILNSCLEPLLKSIKSNNITCDLNARNHELNSPLHLSVLYKSPLSTKLLLENGADYKTADGQNRTAMHLAAYDGRFEVLKILLEYVQPCDIDMVDGCDHTTLQILCGRDLAPGSGEMVKLLLQKQADPKKQNNNNAPAWKLAHDKPELRNILNQHMKSNKMQVDQKECESEEEYESADEGGSQGCLPDLDLYLTEVSNVLDSTNSLFHLAAIFHMDAPLSGKEEISPTTRLLSRLQESKQAVTSEYLANVLEKLGEIEAANIIRKRIGK